MRRMREPGFFRWHHVLFAVPAVALAFGIQYFMRKHHPDSRTSAELSFVTRPSFFKADSGPTAESQAARAIASRNQVASTGKGDWEVVEKKEAKEAAKKVAAKREIAAREEESQNAQAIARVKEQLTAPVAKTEPAAKAQAEGVVKAVETAAKEITGGRAALVGKAETARAPMVPAEISGLKTQHFATRSETAAPAASTTGDFSEGLNVAQGSKNTCMSVEFRGDGPNAVITPKEWAKTIDHFLAVKKDLGDWLAKYRKGFPDHVATVMERQLRAVKIQKPPVTEEPDLSWRGIGAWALDAEKSPVIRLSPGFVKLAFRQPERAKFELARLVAQSWAPCELQRHESLDAWNPLLSCLGVNEKGACAGGSYSEAGWAVSSTVAAVVAPPGCTLPAFAQPQLAQCLKKMPLPLNFAQYETMKPAARAVASAGKESAK